MRKLDDCLQAKPIALLVFCIVLLTACNVDKPRLPVTTTLEPTLDVAIAQPHRTMCPVTASNQCNVDLMGHMGGRVGPVFVQGNYIYLGIGPALTILANSGPSAPKQVGSIVLPGLIQEIYVSGRYAYIAASEAGLRVVDISDNTHPLEIGHSETPTPARDVTVKENYAYVAYSRLVNGMYEYDFLEDGGILVFDISNPAAPTRISIYERTGGATGLAVTNGHLFADFLLCYARGNCTSYLVVLDVSDPHHPTEVSSNLTGTYGNSQYYSQGTATSDIAVVGSQAYIADGDDFRVMDISDPAHPLPIGVNGGYDTPVKGVPSKKSAHDVAVMGRYAYVIDGVYKLRILDISDPTKPTDVGSYSVYGRLNKDVAVAGTYAYVTNDDGLKIIDVSNPSSPREVGTFDARYEFIEGVAESNGHVFAIDSDGMRSVDISNSSQSNAFAKFNFCGRGIDHGSNLTVKDNFIYCLDWRDKKLWIIDASDPAALKAASSYGPGVKGVAVAGNYAYVTFEVWDGNKYVDSLHVIDISNPRQPLKVGVYNVPEIGRNIAVMNNYAYVTKSREKDLLVIDVTNPRQPFEVASYHLPKGATSVVTAGNCVYRTSFAELWILDVTIPTVPQEAGSYHLTGPAMTMAIAGHYAYIVDADVGLRIIDISNSADPVEVGFYNTPSFAFDIAVADNYIYLADGEGGTFALRFNPPAASVQDGNK